MPANFTDITALLQDVNEQRNGAMDKLIAVVYDELRAAAAALFRRQVRPGGRGATLQPTAIVHEAFLKLIKERQQYDRRGDFFKIFKRRMKQVLLDHIRARRAKKRGGDHIRVSLNPDDLAADEGVDIPALVEALDKLETLDSRAADVVTMRVLCGLTIAEVAKSLGVSQATVERDWSFAKPWLANELAGDER